jgi:GTP cyclohydrolase IB
MADDSKNLVDVGMGNLPFPIKVPSREKSEGQQTIANISVRTRIQADLEAHWQNRFIQVLHSHRSRIDTATLSENVESYLKALNADTVRLEFEYPFFAEKTTPVSGEKCLVRYHCNYSAKLTTVWDKPKITFKIHVPVITTDPASDPEKEGGLFGQMSVLTIEIESRQETYPEDLVDLADKHSLSPVYSFLTPDDQIKIIQTAHIQKKSSVEVSEAIKTELAHNRFIEWFSVSCANFGMLHSYNTAIGSEGDIRLPF